MTTTAVVLSDEQRIAQLEAQTRYLKNKLLRYENAVTTIRADLSLLPDHTASVDRHEQAEYFRIRDKNAAARLLLAAVVIRYPNSDLRKRLEKVLHILE